MSSPELPGVVVPFSGPSRLHSQRVVFRHRMERLGVLGTDFELNKVAELRFDRRARSAATLVLIGVDSMKKQGVIDPEHFLILTDERATSALRAGQSIYNVRRNSMGRLAMQYASQSPLLMDGTGNILESRFSMRPDRVEVAINYKGDITVHDRTEDGIWVATDWHQAAQHTVGDERLIRPIRTRETPLESA